MTVPFSVLCRPHDQAEGAGSGGYSMVYAEHRSAFLRPDILLMLLCGGKPKISPTTKTELALRLCVESELGSIASIGIQSPRDFYDQITRNDQISQFINEKLNL